MISDIYIKIAKIEELKRKFLWDDSITYSRNVTFMGNMFLIDTVKSLGYDFDFAMERERKGKLYFKYNNDLQFSISDTKDTIVVALSNKRIGVDIEYLRHNKHDIAKRFFHKRENDYLNALKVEYYDKAFTQLWTIKESYVKMTGEGIGKSFRTVDLSPEKFMLLQDYVKAKSHIRSLYNNNYGIFITTCEKFQ